MYTSISFSRSVRLYRHNLVTCLSHGHMPRSGYSGEFTLTYQNLHYSLDSVNSSCFRFMRLSVLT